jgi:hypothetical protein
VAGPWTCALQYLLHWCAAAGLSLQLFAAPAAGIMVAVEQLLTHIGQPQHAGVNRVANPDFAQYAGLGGSGSSAAADRGAMLTPS